VRLNQVKYGDQLIQHSVRRLEFELGIPNIVLPTQIYNGVCQGMIDSDARWADRKDCKQRVQGQCHFGKMESISVSLGQTVAEADGSQHD